MRVCGGAAWAVVAKLSANKMMTALKMLNIILIYQPISSSFKASCNAAVSRV